LTYGCPEPVKGMEAGNFFQPSILEDIPEHSRAYTEELFGPVFSLYKVSSEQEAIDKANDTIYGLGGALFSKDLEKAEKWARKIDTGFIYVNDFCQTRSDIPAGGTKESGWGKECAKEGLLDLVNSKAIVMSK